MKTTNQKGFSAVEVLIVIIVLALIGGGGFYVYSKQKSKNDNAASPVTTSNSNSDSSKSLTVQDATAKLGDKITSLATGKYKIEKLDGAETEIKVSSSQKLTVSKGDSVFYRTDPLQSSPSAYDTYVSELDKDLDTLNGYASDTLGLKQVNTYEETNEADYTFKNTVYKVGDTYLLISQSAGGYVLAWAK